RDKASVNGEHDRVRQEPRASISGTGRVWLQNGDFSTERVSRFDESQRGISACIEKERHAKGLARQDANPGGALPAFGIRPDGGELDGSARLMICRSAYR